MGTQGGQPPPSVAADLLARPARYDFFRAVFLLERMARDGGGSGARPPVGGDDPVDTEVVRFRAAPGLCFPESTIHGIRERRSPGETQRLGGPVDPRARLEMLVNFMGLTGPAGVLPDHYTVLMMRCVRLKDTAYREFLDIFNHRTVSLFYRAWEKYRVAQGYERARRAGGGPDFVSWVLACLVGLGTDGLPERGRVPDEAFVYYGGSFSRTQRNAISLERMLADYFEVPVSVEQFRGRWLLLDPRDRSRLPSAAAPMGRFNRLGKDLVLGDRSWDVMSGLRLRVGPLDHEGFRRLMPRPFGGGGSEGDMLDPLRGMTRSYVGPELDFDIQVVLRGPQVPRCVLGVEGPEAAILGWSSWLHALPMEEDAGDAVFSGSRLDDAGITSGSGVTARSGPRR